MRMRFSPSKTAWLLAMLVPAIVWGPDVASPVNLAVAAVLIVITVVPGHTVGLHRGIIHRTFAMSERTRRVLAVCFALTGLGGPRAWYRQHALRDHHQSLPVAPEVLSFDHGVLKDLWWTLCCSPVGVDWDAVGLRTEDDEDPWLLAVDRAFLPLQVAQAAVLLALLGWPGFVVAWCGRNALVLVGHWWVGYLGHTCGTRRYRVMGVAEEGRNLAWLGVLSFGEGFHNNHHAAPSCARIGRGRWEVDLGWWTIVAMERLGLVWDVNRPHDPHDFLRLGACLAEEMRPAERPRKRVWSWA